MKVIDADVHFRESHLPNGKSHFRCHRISLFVSSPQCVGLAPPSLHHSDQSRAESRRSIHGSHGWTDEQAIAFAGRCREHGFRMYVWNGDSRSPIDDQCGSH